MGSLRGVPQRRCQCRAPQPRSCRQGAPCGRFPANVVGKPPPRDALERKIFFGGGSTRPPPPPGQPTPGVVQQHELSRGSVDTTKTRSGPQRVRMSSGERPIGAAKGKQSDTG